VCFVVTLCSFWSALAQDGDLPLHEAAAHEAEVQVVAALLQAYPAGASRATKV